MNWLYSSNNVEQQSQQFQSQLTHKQKFKQIFQQMKAVYNKNKTLHTLKTIFKCYNSNKQPFYVGYKKTVHIDNINNKQELQTIINGLQKTVSKLLESEYENEDEYDTESESESECDCEDCDCGDYEEDEECDCDCDCNDDEDCEDDEDCDDDDDEDDDEDEDDEDDDEDDEDDDEDADSLPLCKLVQKQSQNYDRLLSRYYEQKYIMKYQQDVQKTLFNFTTGIVFGIIMVVMSINYKR